MDGFSRKAWSRDPFYGWRTQELPEHTQSSQVREMPQARAPPSRAESGARSMLPVKAAANAPRAQDPFAAWRSGMPAGTEASTAFSVDSLTAARQITAKDVADPFSNWRPQMPQADIGSATRMATRKGVDPFGSWRPQMQQTPPTQAALTQRVQRSAGQRTINPVVQRTIGEDFGRPAVHQETSSEGVAADARRPDAPSSVPLLAAAIQGALGTLAPWTALTGCGYPKDVQPALGQSAAPSCTMHGARNKFGNFC